MATARHASHRMDALERRIAELEAQSQPLGKTCPECHAFGLESYVLRTVFGGRGLQMTRCRFCAFAEEEMPASASSLPRAPSAAKDGGPAVNSQERRSAASATNRGPSRTTPEVRQSPARVLGSAAGADWRAWPRGE